MEWLLLLLIAFIFQIATILIVEFRNPGKAMAWMFILFLVPIIGFVLYYFIAQEYKKRRTLRRRGTSIFQMVKETVFSQSKVIHHISEMHPPVFSDQTRLFGLLTKISENPITGHNQVKVMSESEKIFAAMLAAMERATHHIHMEFYIFRHDGIGTKFQEVLIRKAMQGVKVRVIYDGLGSYKLKSSFIAELRHAGVDTRAFLPPWIATLDRRVNYRNHRKILIVDGNVGFMGGINVGDEYLGLSPKLGFWRDTHLELKGDSVYFLQNTFLDDWSLVSGEIVSGDGYYPPHPWITNKSVQILTSGPDQHWDTVQELYFGAISAAKERIWITSPYFIPDPALNTALKTAAVSGVDVKVLIPDQGDSRVVQLASHSYVEELMQAGVQFYQYTKGFVHAKVIIIDGLMGSVGTANMDMRSFFYNFEMIALLFDEESITELITDFQHDLEDSRQIQLQTFQLRPRLQKGAELLARLISPLL